jgi:hypothetical protein
MREKKVLLFCHQAFIDEIDDNLKQVSALFLYSAVQLQSSELYLFSIF